MKFLRICWPLLLSIVLLTSIGILVIYSSSKELGIQQLIYTVVGLALFLLVASLDLRSFGKLIKPFYLLIALTLVLVLIIGVETRGSIRWIPVGQFNIQPSEFAKPALILLLGLFWARHSVTWTNVFKSLIWVLPILILIFKQPDLGTALTMVAIWMGVIFATRPSLKKMIALILIGVLIIPSTWFFLHDYQRQRIIGFLHPESDSLGRGYNVIQSTIAVGSGQFLGKGLGSGTQSRLRFLPEYRTDFIFASIAEEMGLLGSLIILSVYLYLLMFCLKVANQSEDKFYYLATMGVFSMLLFQTFVNVSMNIGILPITGITLPLISYGGSSMIATLISLGIVASVAKSERIG